MRRDSSRLRWRGPRPGPIASIVTEHRRSLGTTWPEWSPRLAMARRGRRWDSGSSASRTGLAPLPGDVDFMVGASLPMPGLTAWQGLFEHGRLRAGQSVLAHGAAGVVGSMANRPSDLRA